MSNCFNIPKFNINSVQFDLIYSKIKPNQLLTHSYNRQFDVITAQLPTNAAEFGQLKSCIVPQLNADLRLYYELLEIDPFFGAYLYCDSAKVDLNVEILNIANDTSKDMIIRIDMIKYKYQADILLILSALFDKIYITKPAICDMAEIYRYIVCKNRNCDCIQPIPFPQPGEYIHSILAMKIPYHILIRIEESNVIYGQYQLDIFCQIISLQNHPEKKDAMMNASVQKLHQWYDKHNISYVRCEHAKRGSGEKKNIFVRPAIMPLIANNGIEAMAVSDVFLQ